MALAVVKALGPDVAKTLGVEAIQNYFLKKNLDKVGDVVQNLLDDAQKKFLASLDKMAGAMSIQEATFWNHATLYLQNFRNFYAEEMEKTVEKVDDVVKMRLFQMDSIIHNRTEGFLKTSEIQSKIQTMEALFSSLTNLMGGKPLVTKVTPTCIAPLKSDDSIVIKCMGFFPSAASPQLKPLFKVKDQTFKPFKNIGNVMEYAIPSTLLPSPQPQSFTGIGFSLMVPYIEKGYIYNTPQYLDYQGWLSLLPLSPGKFKLQHIVVREIETTKPLYRHFWQNSKKASSGGTGYSMIDHSHTLEAGEGWKIVPGSAKLVVAQKSGDAEARVHSEGPAAAIFLVTTHHKKHDQDSGVIEVGIYATAAKVDRTYEEKTEELNLNWGDSFHLDPKKYKDWKVTFEAFNGVKKEYRGNVEDPFVSIQSSQGIPILTVNVPGDLTSPVVPVAKL